MMVMMMMMWLQSFHPSLVALIKKQRAREREENILTCPVYIYMYVLMKPPFDVSKDNINCTISITARCVYLVFTDRYITVRTNNVSMSEGVCWGYCDKRQWPRWGRRGGGKWGRTKYGQEYPKHIPNIPNTLNIPNSEKKFQEQYFIYNSKEANAGRLYVCMAVIFAETKSHASYTLYADY